MHCTCASRGSNRRPRRHHTPPTETPRSATTPARLPREPYLAWRMRHPLPPQPHSACNHQPSCRHRTAPSWAATDSPVQVFASLHCAATRPAQSTHRPPPSPQSRPPRPRGVHAPGACCRVCQWTSAQAPPPPALPRSALRATGKCQRVASPRGNFLQIPSACVCVCVCVCARARARACVRACVCVHLGNTRQRQL